MKPIEEPTGDVGKNGSLVGDELPLAKEKTTTLYKTDEYIAFREYYNEWMRLSRYLTTVSFTAIAFSVTITKMSPAQTRIESPGTLVTGWIFLLLSALFGGSSMLISYWGVFDVVTRWHMQHILRHFGFIIPTPNSTLPVIAGRASLACVMLALLFLISGILLIVLFATKQIMIGAG